MKGVYQMDPDVRREIRESPLSPELTYILSGSDQRLYNTQVGVEGKEIDLFSRNDATVSVITPTHPLVLLEEDPVGAMDGVYERQSAKGADERFKVNRFDPEGLELLINSLIARAKTLRADPTHGASLRHFNPYWAYHPGNVFGNETLVGRQLASKLIPPTIEREIERAEPHFANKSRCLYCDIVTEEIKNADDPDSRMVFLTEHHIGFVPFSSSRPYSVHVYPLRHTARLTGFSEEQIRDLATSVWTTMLRTEALAANHGKVDSVNVAIYTPPYINGSSPYTKGDQIDRFYHTHLEIFPYPIPKRISESYEIPGSGIFVSAIRPKSTAKSLRF